MLSNSIVERGSVFLVNINANSNNTAARGAEWVSSSAGAYAIYSIPYSTPLCPNHYYYQRIKYKFTTTNQSPTWCNIYIQGGSNSHSYTLNNPVANTEYTVSGVKQPSIAYTNLTLQSGTVYNGPSNAIAGCIGYCKEVITYDVTDLYHLLAVSGTVATVHMLKEWCDSHLVWHPAGEIYDITNIVPTENKIGIHSGGVVADNIVEADGMGFYATTYNNGDPSNLYFDLGTTKGIYLYNNKGNGTVTHSIVNAKEQDSPFWAEHPNCLKIQTSGEASPGAGGFGCLFLSEANKVFVTKFVAKIPVGYSIVYAYNSLGTGFNISYITSRAGTGKWEEYGILWKCGSSGSFSTGGFAYISGSNNQNVTWYLAYAASCDITGKEYLKNYSVLPTKTAVKAGNIYVPKIATNSMVPNGDFRNHDSSLLPSGCTFDTTDTAGASYASLVQPIGVGGPTLKVQIPIDPSGYYKLSYWVKCKGDMSSFLTAIRYVIKGVTTLSHTYVVYVPNTVTTLAKELKSGDTTATLTSSANWKVKNHSRLGFRSGGTYSLNCWNDMGTFGSGTDGVVASVSGNVINLRQTYSGTTIPATTAVVESYDGGNYPYPIQKSQLPTNNTWKYVEGYFGNASTNYVWNGAAIGGNSWAGIPCRTTHIDIVLNLYNNNGTVPIKYADIRLEAVNKAPNGNFGNAIQFETSNIGGN